MGTPASPRARRRSGSKRLWGLLIFLLFLLGCASSAKLAKKSQEQLAEGKTRKAYETALKAVDKDPYNESARAALAEAGAAMMAHEVRMLRSTVQVDTVEAAEVALRMAGVRTETALRGVSLPIDSLVAAEENAVRVGAARVYIGLGDDQMDAGAPKDAYRLFLAAERFAPQHPLVASRLEESYEAAVDRVLVVPVRVESRVPVDREAISERLYDALADQAQGRLQFTELVPRGDEWARMLALPPGRLTQDRALRIARDANATRATWVRIYGDRVDSHTESFAGTLYHPVKRKRADGGEATVWEEVPFRAAVHDLWASVAMECEVYDLGDERVVARRAGERGAGLRALRSSTGFPGDADDYVLCTPDMERTDRTRCRDLKKAWSETMGGLSVEDFVELANDEPRVIVFGRAKRYGGASRNNRSYAVYYGVPPVEVQLIDNALGDVWREAAKALAEADSR